MKNADAPGGRRRLASRIISSAGTAGCLAAVMALAGCGTARGTGAGGQLLARGGAGCATTVRGVIPWHGRVVPLPLAPGRIVSRARAIAAARRVVAGTPATGGFAVAAVTARLTSWTEVLALLRASPYRGSLGPLPPPSGLAAAPWRPVWAVLLSPFAAVRGTPPPASPAPAGSAPPAGTAPAGTASAAALPGDGSPTPGTGSVGPALPYAELAVPQVVLVGAASGRAEFSFWAGPHPSWFTALTDRDPALRGCPGGSTARLPFGVLTRDEEQYVIRPAAGGRTAPGKTSVTVPIVKLTTVRALYRADPGLYGGCVRQDCSLAELIWPRIDLIRARPGRTLACLPPQASYPPGYQPKQVRQYAAISVPGNYEIDCTGLPGWVSRLADLAPPGPGSR